MGQRYKKNRTPTKDVRFLIPSICAGGPADGETPLHVRGVAEAVQDTGKTGHCHR